MALPGRMYAPVYRGMGYSTLNLSRAVEEGGTLVAPLNPWNAGGAFVISALALGVSSGNMENQLYIPLTCACWIERQSAVKGKREPFRVNLCGRRVNNKKTKTK